MRTWTMVIPMTNKITDEEVGKHLGVKPESVTEAQVKAFAADIQESWAGSNDGSEMIANERVVLVQTDGKIAVVSDEVARKAIATLNEVRTGEDFECECHEVARELEASIDGKPYKKGE